MDKFTALAEFDGSVVARNAGEVSARCHDEQANFHVVHGLHGIVTGAKSVQARDYYVKGFCWRKKPTPYMESCASVRVTKWLSCN